MSDSLDQFITRCDEPDDAQALRDWSANVWCPLTSDRVVLDPMMGLHFRPHEAADHALIRVSLKHPDAVRVIRETLAECETTLARAGEPDQVDLGYQLADSMMRLAQRVRVLADGLKAEATPATAPEPPPQPTRPLRERISIDIEKQTVTVDGTVYHVDNEPEAKLFAALTKAPAGYLSATALETAIGYRPRKVIERLPTELKKLVIAPAERGKRTGYRLAD